jgi:SAM-dependent methyltransferase
MVGCDRSNLNRPGGAILVYDRFASIYQRGIYLRFSESLAESILPEYLLELGIEPEDLLDVACGEGTFAVMMAQRGYHVTGIDQSERMIDLAKKRAREADVDASFLIEDMRSLPFTEKFDLVTCFFDSLNYLLAVKDLQEAFLNVYQALKPGGYFIFDMNTVYGLAVDWMRVRDYIHNETEDFIEIHHQDFDYENLIASMTITVFEKHGRFWDRFDEVHRERGYPIADIEFLLTQVGFEIIGIFGNLSKRCEVQNTSSRVWFTAHKAG